MSPVAQPPPGRDRAAEAVSSTSRNESDTPESTRTPSASTGPWWRRLASLVADIEAGDQALDEDTTRRLELLAGWIRQDVERQAWATGRYSIAWQTSATSFAVGVTVDGEAAAIAAIRDAQLAGHTPIVHRILVDGGDGPGTVAGVVVRGGRLEAS